MFWKLILNRGFKLQRQCIVQHELVILNSGNKSVWSSHLACKKHHDCRWDSKERPFLVAQRFSTGCWEILKDCISMDCNKFSISLRMVYPPIARKLLGLQTYRGWTTQIYDTKQPLNPLNRNGYNGKDHRRCLYDQLMMPGFTIFWEVSRIIWSHAVPKQLLRRILPWSKASKRLLAQHWYPIKYGWTVEPCEWTDEIGYQAWEGKLRDLVAI